MRRESHVRSCESGRVRFPPATHQNGTYGLIGGRWGCRKLWRDGTRTRRGNPAGLSPSRPTGDAEPAAYLTERHLMIVSEALNQLG
jgi:hypothetical protein